MFVVLIVFNLLLALYYDGVFRLLLFKYCPSQFMATLNTLLKRFTVVTGMHLMVKKFYHSSYQRNAEKCTSILLACYAPHRMQSGVLIWRYGTTVGARATYSGVKHKISGARAW